MRRLDRYIFRETLFPALIALVALTFVVFAREIGRLLQIIIRQSATASEIWEFSAAILPTVLGVTLPMGVLVGILTGFGRMSSDSEMIALRASGVSMLRIFRPVLVLAVCAWAVTLALTVWISPKTSARLPSLYEELAKKYVSLELQEGVFFEKLKDMVLYVNHFNGDNALQWRGIMLADVKNPDNPEVTFAESGSLVLDEATRRLQLTLSNASEHVIFPQSPEKDKISKLDKVTTLRSAPEIPITTARPVTETPTRELWRRMGSGESSYQEQVEFHRRFALPFACFAFALIAVPLGVSTTRGGKSVGLVLSLILMLTYYLALIGGTRMAGENGLSPALGAWLPNIGFALLGLILLLRSDRVYENRALATVGRAIEWASTRLASVRLPQLNVNRWAYPLTHHSKFFRLLDVYVLRGFWFFFTIVLSVFVVLFIIVTLFELLSDIVMHNVPTSTIVTYFIFLLPQIFYWMAPLAVLLAILINLGTLTKTNEVLAVKAGAVSLYRMSLPLILMGGLLSVVIYVMQDFVLPHTNQKQDEYHDMIKGKQPQTHRDPSRKWMKGSTSQIYHYNFFDSEANVFGNISIMKVDPETFALREWIFAQRGFWKNGSWTFENGWIRKIAPDQSPSYAPKREAFDTLNAVEMESPDYFKKEVREADQMNYAELKRYVEELRQRGFDVTGLTLDLYRKLSFPLVPLIMALIGVPFSFKTGRKGAFYGIGLSLALGITYWSTFELFEKLGGINRLSPFIAAWFPNLIFGAGGFWMMLRVKT